MPSTFAVTGITTTTSSSGPALRAGDTLTLTLTRMGRALMGEVAAARFQSLCSAMGVECVVQ